MPVITTYRIIILVMIWLYHLTTSLNINAGYYVNPFLQQPLNFGHTSVPQLMWPTYIFSGHNTVTTRDRPNVYNENQAMARGNHFIDNENKAMTRGNPFVNNQNQAMTRGNPVVDNENQAMTRENPVVDDRNQAMTHEIPAVDYQNEAMTRENPIVDNQNKVMSVENPVTDDHNYTMSRETPIVDNQNYAMARENSVVVGQDRNLQDYSFNHIQPKCSSCPHRGTKELTNGADDSATFVHQGGSDDKLISEGEVALVGNRTNNISAGSTSNLLPTAVDPSRCVWAIISCCSPGSSNVRNPCFELLGCPGPFWDTKPCNEKITGAALKVIGEFYSNGKLE